MWECFEALMRRGLFTFETYNSYIHDKENHPFRALHALLTAPLGPGHVGGRIVPPERQWTHRLQLQRRLALPPGRLPRRGVHHLRRLAVGNGHRPPHLATGARRGQRRPQLSGRELVPQDLHRAAGHGRTGGAAALRGRHGQTALLRQRAAGAPELRRLPARHHQPDAGRGEGR